MVGADMNSNILVSIVSLFYITLLLIIFFIKRSIKLKENIIYNILIVDSFFMMAFEIISYYILKANISYESLLYNIISKLILISYLIWVILFFLYMITITLNEKSKLLSKISKITIMIYTIVFGIVIALPLKYININELHIPAGVPTYSVYGLAIVSDIVLIIIVFLNLNKRYIPLAVLFILGVIVLLYQMSHPDCFLISHLLTFTTFLMYFTIENPDMKLLTEMHEAKEISDNANEEKTLFLYNMTQEIRATTKNIDAEADIIIDSDNIDTDKESARNIKGETSKFRMMTNDILDVSAIDSSKVKIYNTSYSIKMLLRTIISSYNEICKNKNIEFRTNIDHNIPESLYGDNINLKKVLKELLDYSVKSTSKGYIELNINTIIKNDIARLIITIEDSSMGLKSSVLERITIDNKVFSSVYKLITLMNGTMVITSNYGTGNKIKIILDQKIEPSISIEEKKYQSILDNKKILIIDNTESTIKVIEKLLKESNIDIDYSLNGKDAYNKIKTRNRYDLILLDEELSMMTGVELLNYLKKIRNFNIPVILLSKDNKYEYNEEYLNMGFTDILIKPIKKTSLLECINKNIINREDVLTKNKETK